MISIEDLSVKFRQEHSWEEVVHSVSFHVDEGSTLGIVGESGAGKSLIALSIMRLLNPDISRVSGKIVLNGTDILAISEKEMQTYRGSQIAMIFQEPMTSLNPVLTCGFQVAEAIKKHNTTIAHADIRAEVIRLFTEVNLPRPERIADGYPHELSGGQKQRVMIAMALSCNPSLLIADEPTTALDATVQKAILDLLLSIRQKRNMSMIFITHDLGVIGKVADKVMVMRDGRIVERGTASKILTAPEEAYTRALLSSRPVAGRKIRRLPVLSDFTGGTPGEVFLNIEITGSETSKHLDALYANEPLLEVKNLSASFSVRKGFFKKPEETVKAVDDVSFAIYPGEIMGLVGESGSGKTTLGRCLLRLIAPSSGEIRYRGKDLLTLTPSEMLLQRRKMQIMFQDPYSSLNPTMTIGEALTEPMLVHKLFPTAKQCKERALYLLEKVNMKPEHYYRYPHEFSGGQRQRIGIARTLALEPEFIVCDETVSALDVSVQAQVLNLLQDLQKEFNLTYLFISHDLSVVYHLCDRIIVLNNGKIEETGYPRQLFTSPTQPYTQKLLEAVL